MAGDDLDDLEKPIEYLENKQILGRHLQQFLYSSVNLLTPSPSCHSNPR